MFVNKFVISIYFIVAIGGTFSAIISPTWLFFVSMKIIGFVC